MTRSQSFEIGKTLETPSDLLLSTRTRRHISLLRMQYVHNCRQELVNDVLIILRKYDLTNLIYNEYVYLYGHHEISKSDNRNTLMTTIKHINKSGWFL